MENGITLPKCIQSGPLGKLDVDRHRPDTVHSYGDIPRQRCQRFIHKRLRM